MELKAAPLSENPRSIYKRHIGVREVCRWCRRTVRDEVWATAISEDGVWTFRCDVCGKDVDNEGLRQSGL